MTDADCRRNNSHTSGDLVILSIICGTLKCENSAICEKVAKCEKNSTLNVKIDAVCEQITLNGQK